jgi:hypothetical protein
MNNSCPNCGTVYNITPQLIGKSTSCKKCGAQLVIDASGLQLAGGGQFRPGSDFDFRPSPRGPSSFGQFITFRVMVSPWIIKYVLFWILVAFNIYLGIQAIGLSFRIGLGSGGWSFFFLGLGHIIVGPIFVRFLCELMLLFFRFVDAHCEINDTLKEIKKK